MKKRNNEGLTYVEGQGYEGVVYVYECNATGMKYVGVTVREQTRRKSWSNPGNAYAGAKIRDARKEYGVYGFTYTVLERLYSENLEALEDMLEEREEFYIDKYDSCNSGYNGNRGGSGNKGIVYDEKRKEQCGNAMRGKHHTTETRLQLSQSLSGHEVKESTRAKISQGNTGKVRTEKMKQAQSERMKGTNPTAATEGAKKWREENGGGYWKGKTMSEEAKAKMKAAQQERGTTVIAHFPDGSSQEFATMLDAEKATGVKVGSIHNNLKHSSESFKTKGGFWFEKQLKR